MSISTYSQYVYPDKLISPINGYARKRITKANVYKFGFKSIEELHELYPNFPLNCNDTILLYKTKAKEYTNTVSSHAELIYARSPVRCQSCDIILPFNKRTNKFCSNSCAASYNNKLRAEVSEEQREKTSKSLRAFNANNPEFRKTVNYANQGSKVCHVVLLECKCCDKSFYARKADSWRATCSPECARKNSTYRKIVIEYDHDGETLLLESSWELEIAKWLDTMNLNWIRPKHVPWVDNTGKTRRYFPDFYLPDYDLYLDPKNPYIILKDKEKLEVVSTKINLVYGKVEHIKQEVLSIIC